MQLQPAPKAHMQTTAPKAHMQTTAPKAHMQTTVPKAHMQTTAPKAHMQTTAPKAHMQTTAPKAQLQHLKHTCKLQRLMLNLTTLTTHSVQTATSPRLTSLIDTTPRPAEEDSPTPISSLTRSLRPPDGDSRPQTGLLPDSTHPLHHRQRHKKMARMT